MKNLILIIFLFLNLSSFCQVNNGIVLNLLNKKIIPKPHITDSLRLDQIIYCLDKYQNGMIKSMGVGIIGAGTAGIAISSKDDNLKNKLIICSSFCILFSVIEFLDTQSWLSRRNLSFSKDGMAYRF